MTSCRVCRLLYIASLLRCFLLIKRSKLPVHQHCTAVYRVKYVQLRSTIGSVMTVS